MKGRIIFWAFVIVILAVGFISAKMFRLEDEFTGVLGGITTIIVPVFTIALIIVLIRAGVKGGMQSTTSKPAPAVIDGPGKFKVDGIDRDSRMDTTMHVVANSIANARAKAELEGVVVTAVTRVY